MANHVFTLLKDQYKKDGAILSGDALMNDLGTAYPPHAIIEGIYQFDTYLDAYRSNERVE